MSEPLRQRHLHVVAVVVCVVAALTQLAWAASPRRDLAAQAPELNPDVLSLALQAKSCADVVMRDRAGILTVIDYTLPSTEPRLWVFDLERRELLFRELVAHGKNTGEDHATEFSNRRGSKQSSVGLFLTGGTYHGRNGYSLKLHGLEDGINHHALDRTIVLHGAWYVNEEFAARHGRLGRSWGCPAVRSDVAKPLIDVIKGGSYLFVYYPEPEWLEGSSFLRDCGGDMRGETPAAVRVPPSSDGAKAGP
jgi:hypothetical protein